ncbi:ArsR/SmtB family transcription factor [Membranihabitans marinus]|uniref:ArsR/SmtB family transcription factor n=1 Tax=Membranihabitans marinus TaxID=1227546 RepID=UPI001EFFFCBB|nr:metalloregulator ArsR/SmtB family transcription factor [Membranihabitans marinus]
MKTTKVTLNPERVGKAWAIAHALAHPLRLRILEFIDSMGSTNVNRIYRALDIEQSITSQHLRILRDAGIVVNEKDGKYVHYAINYERVENAAMATSAFAEVDRAYTMVH